MLVEVVTAQDDLCRRGPPVTRRSREEAAGFFSGLELVEPGVVRAHRWHPEPGISTKEYEVSAWAAGARKN